MTTTTYTTTEEIYFTRTPENWAGSSWDHLSQGVRLPAGTQVIVTNTTNAGFRGIEYRITTNDNRQATVSGDKLRKAPVAPQIQVNEDEYGFIHITITAPKGTDAKNFGRKAAAAARKTAGGLKVSRITSGASFGKVTDEYRYVYSY